MLIFVKDQNTTNLNATLVTIVLYTVFTCRWIHWHKHIYAKALTHNHTASVWELAQFYPESTTHTFLHQPNNGWDHKSIYKCSSSREFLLLYGLREVKISPMKIITFLQMVAYATPVAINECSVNFYYLKLLMNCDTPAKSYHTPLNLIFQSIMIKGR